MKIFTKVMLIIAGVFATVGIVCTVLAFAMGLTATHLKDMVQDGRFSFNEGDLHISFEDDRGNDVGDEIISTEKDGDLSTYMVQEVCKSMDVEFGAGVLEIYYDDVENIQIKQMNIPNLKVSVKNETLIIREGANVNIDLDDVEDRQLVVVIPSDMKFEEVTFEIGAGQATISNIITEQLDLEVAAGQATVKNLSADIIDVEAGVGQAIVELNGVQEEYNYDIECGVGNVVVGNISYGGLGAEQRVTHDEATKEIKVECGIGEVKIKFAK